MLKGYFAGNETNIGNTVAAMSFNDYAVNIPKDGMASNEGSPVSFEYAQTES